MRTTKRSWLLFIGQGLFAVMIMLACTGQNGRNEPHQGPASDTPQKASSQALISFDTLYHDFGTIIEGEMVVCYFEYQNRGENDLVINSVESTCGCTTPDWKREPLKPGEKEILKVVFDATGRSGSQRKVVTVLSNASNSAVMLTLTANIN